MSVPFRRPAFVSSPSPALAAALLAVALPALLPATAAAQSQQWYQFAPNHPQIQIGAGEHWGRSVCFLPDITGDGRAEVLIGAPQEAGKGAAVLVSGASGSQVLELWSGIEANSSFGQTVCNAGDVNGDGKADVLVSCPRDDVPSGFFNLQDAGTVKLYDSVTGAVLRSFSGNASGARFGEALAGGADATGDGVPDVLIGAPYWDNGDFVHAGYAELYSGATGALVARYEGNQDGQVLGWSVAFLGGLTADFASEYAIGSAGYDKFTLAPPFDLRPNCGQVQVYNGFTKALMFTLWGQADDEFGSSICSVGDSNGNGLREFLIGAPRTTVGALGYASLYEGSAGGYVRSYQGPINGTAFGSWVCKAGDLDKDGRMEVAIGATQAGVSGGGGVIRVFDADDGVTIKTTYYLPGDGAGQFASFDGGYDINGDGWPDLLVGSPNSDVSATNGGLVRAYGQLHYQQDLGFAGPHPSQLEIYGGRLKTGSKADLRLSGVTGLPGVAHAYLLVSLGAPHAPFKGGTLVPAFTPGLLVHVVTNGQGEFKLPGIAGGGGPLTLYAQAIIPGYGGAQPFGLSNALKVVLEP